jgi:hypothetical protein
MPMNDDAFRVSADVRLALATTWPAPNLMGALESLSTNRDDLAAGLERYQLGSRSSRMDADAVLTALLPLIDESTEIRSTIESAVAEDLSSLQAATLASEITWMLRLPDLGELPAMQELFARLRDQAGDRVQAEGSPADFVNFLSRTMAEDPYEYAHVEEAVSRIVAESVVFWSENSDAARAYVASSLMDYLGDAPQVSESFDRLSAGPRSSAAVNDFIDSITPVLVDRPRARDALLLTPLSHPLVTGRLAKHPGVEVVEVGPPDPEIDRPISGYPGDDLFLEVADEARPPRDSQDESLETPRTVEAFPLLRPQGVKPDDDFAVAEGVPFELEVGIAASLDRALAATGGLGDVVLGTRITIHLAYDPAQFEIKGSLPVVVTPTKDDPFPSTTVRVLPLHLGATRVENRRIAAHFLIDGSLRGIAVRAFREAGEPPPPSNSTPARIDLAPLVNEDPPDIILAVYRADIATRGTYFIAAFPRDVTITPPPIGRVILDEATAAAVADLYSTAERAADPRARYLELRGCARDIGLALPAPLRAVLKQIAEDAPEERAATMLLLTDDPSVPWELAMFPRAERLSSAPGGDAPWLGAHFSIGRWPISASAERALKPEAGPIDVQRTALVTAGYEGSVGGWKPLAGALAEVEELKTSYAPAEVWKPLRMELLEKLATDVDVVHFAMHGKYDPRGVEDGLVFIDGPAGKRRATYLGSRMLAGRIDEDPPLLPRRPFVFLNACQVGRTSKKNLGDYGGLAAVLLDAGARGVVACTWNVDDGVAGSISSEFYAGIDAGHTPAELLRRVRARYVVEDGQATDSVPSATLIAYQFYGHPNLRVLHTK